jgi:ABC-type transporter Mla MlaB component
MGGSILIDIGHEAKDHRTLRLAGDINVFLAAELHRCAVQVAEGASSVTVECGQVASLDMAAIDAILAQGGSFGVSGMPQEAADAVDLAGLARRLGLNEATPTAVPVPVE